MIFVDGGGRDCLKNFLGRLGVWLILGVNVWEFGWWGWFEIWVLDLVWSEPNESEDIVRSGGSSLVLRILFGWIICE